MNNYCYDINYYWNFDISENGEVSIKTNFGSQSIKGNWKLINRFSIQSVYISEETRTLIFNCKSDKCISRKIEGKGSSSNELLITFFSGRSKETKNALIHLQTLLESKKPLFSD